MVKLYNVMDIRNGRIYSEVIVKASKAHFFVPVESE